MGVELSLFIAGSSEHAPGATEAARHICRMLPRGYCELRIVDVETEPDAAERERVFAVPALVRTAPPPQRRVVGELTDVEAVLDRLDLVVPE